MFDKNEIIEDYGNLDDFLKRKFNFSNDRTKYVRYENDV